MDFEDVLFPDFDDIAVPPEPNEDSDRGKEAEQARILSFKPLLNDLFFPYVQSHASTRSSLVPWQKPNPRFDMEG